MQAWAWVLVGMGFVDRYGSNFLLPPRHFYILPTDNKKIAIGGVVFGCDRWVHKLWARDAHPYQSVMGIGFGGVWAIDRPISGRGAFSAPAISKQGFRSIHPIPSFIHQNYF
jgi:hypothetical protein